MDNCLEKLLRSKKYRVVCLATIQRLWDEYTVKYKKPKDVDKAVREALHGITGAFLTPDEAKQCAKALEAWREDRTDARLEAVLNLHASTRERLPLDAMDALYDRIFAVTGRPGRVLDLACGINPIYLGARGISATGVDLSAAAVDLVNAFGPPVNAVCADLLCEGGIPKDPFDVALMFKILPLLERQKTGAAVAVMEAVDAQSIVASFPTRTLGGRNVGMASHYTDWMEAHTPANRTVAERFETDNELFFILKRQ